MSIPVRLVACAALVLLLQPRATLADRTHKVAPGRWFSVHDQRWRLSGSARTASMPWSVLASPENSSVYVAHVGVGQRGKDNVWRYQRDGLERVAYSKFDGHGVELALHDGLLLVTNSRADQLLALDPQTLAVVRRYATGSIPKDFGVAGRHAYVALWGAGGVAKINLHDARRKVLTTGARTRGLALSPDGTLGVATNFGANTVSFFDPRTMKSLGQIWACGAPRHAVFSPGGDSLWVSCHGSDEVLEIDPDRQKVLRRIGVAAGPKTLALRGDLVIVAAEDAHALSVVSRSDGSVRTLELPARKPCGLFVTSERVYVTAQGSHQLLVFEYQ